MRPHPDYGTAAILIYIGLFGLYCAVAIVKDGWLGWAMFYKNLAYATAWTWAGLAVLFPQVAEDPRVRDGIRWLVVLAVTWAAIQLTITRYLLWKNQRSVRALVGWRARRRARKDQHTE